MLFVDKYKISLALTQHKLTLEKATPKIQGKEGTLHFKTFVTHRKSLEATSMEGLPYTKYLSDQP